MSMSLLNDFCAEFGLTEEALGHVTRLGRDCFLTLPEHDAFIAAHRHSLRSAGLFLGREQKRFEPSPAVIECIAAAPAARRHKVVVDEKAEWLFLCGRDLFVKAITRAGTPTRSGFVLVQNARDENLGLGLLRRRGNVAVKNLLDRGFFLRRERSRRAR